MQIAGLICLDDSSLTISPRPLTCKHEMRPLSKERHLTSYGLNSQTQCHYVAVCHPQARSGTIFAIALIVETPRYHTESEAPRNSTESKAPRKNTESKTPPYLPKCASPTSDPACNFIDRIHIITSQNNLQITRRDGSKTAEPGARYCSNRTPGADSASHKYTKLGISGCVANEAQETTCEVLYL